MTAERIEADLMRIPPKNSSETMHQYQEKFTTKMDQLARKRAAGRLSYEEKRFLVMRNQPKEVRTIVNSRNPANMDSLWEKIETPTAEAQVVGQPAICEGARRHDCQEEEGR